MQSTIETDKVVLTLNGDDIQQLLAECALLEAPGGGGLPYDEYPILRDLHALAKSYASKYPTRQGER